MLLTRAAKTNDGVEERWPPSTLWNGRMTPKTKVWDKRFPMIQRGPWYREDAVKGSVHGFKLRSAFKSEYQDEIKMIFPGDAEEIVKS